MSAISISVPRLAPRRGVMRVLSLLLFGFLLSACVVNGPLTRADAITDQDMNSRVLVMPMDVELQELTAGGELLPQAAWTATGRANVAQAISALMAERGDALVNYGGADSEGEIDAAHLQVVKLHGVVGGTIIAHSYIPALKLPTKDGKLDWTLGEQAAALRDSYDADYALFVFFRDSFSTGGRAAVVFFGALLGVHVQGGLQIGFASLVDLRSGDVVWFNRLFSQAGDLRKPDMAHDATKTLLKDLPL